MEAYHPGFYDHYFTGVEGDVAFYVEEARQAGSPVLEVGCGTGRVLLPMAAAGIQVTGLEQAESLLSRARCKLAGSSPQVQQNVQLVQGDMRAFSLDQRFAMVAIPYRTFQHLLTPEEQEETLEGIRRHLREGGVLIFNVFDPLRDMVEQGFAGPLKKDTDFIDPETGHQILVWYSRHYDPEIQLLEQELIFEEVDGEGGIASRSCSRLTLRYTWSGEMQYLLEGCGFEVEALYGDFQGSAFPGYGEQVWVARKV